MYNEDVSIDFSANISPLSASLNQAIKQIQGFGAGADTATAKLTKFDEIALKGVKSLGKFVDLNKTATSAAAAYQQKLAGLNTVSSLSEKQFGHLSDVAMKFARQFPIGLDNSIQLVNTLRTSGVNTTSQIEKLGKTFINLQAATGDWGSGLVSDMLSVNRTFGHSFESVGKFGDSLVTLTNNFGANASSVAGFTKAIAPFSAAMGVSETSTLGMSTAFSRLGEDGMRSASALNKVMSDLTMSIKTGSPEAAKYASAMGMTTKQLKDLASTDPTEVLVRFTEAINKKGPQAINTLNQLGIDGIQTYKSLQVLGKSNDLRDMLQTARDSYGNGASQKGAKTAMGTVNDEMGKFSESMQQTVATAGTPFLSLIGGLLKGLNGIAEVVNRTTSWFSRMAKDIAPLLAVLKVFHTLLATIAAVRFASFLGKSIAGSGFGQAFGQGREAAATNQIVKGGSLGYRMGAWAENNMSGLMGKSMGERIGDVKNFAKGAAGYGLAGLMNLQSSFYRGSPEEQVNKQLNTRTMSENLRRSRYGFEPISRESMAAREQVNENRVAAGKAPIEKPTGPTVGFGDQLKGVGKAIQSFGADLKATGASARWLGVTSKTVGGELRLAFQELIIATGKATLAVGGMAVKGIGKMAGSLASSLGMMAAISVAIGAFQSIKEGTDKAHKLRDEGWKAASNDSASVYNDFAEKAGLATINVNALAVAAKDAAHQLVIQSTNMDTANKLSQQDIAAATAPGYKPAENFGKNKSVQDIYNQVVNLEGANPSPQARKQLLMDITNQYGAGTAGQISDMLANNVKSSNLPAQNKQLNSSDVYKAGFNEIEGQKTNRWWSSSYRALQGTGLGLSNLFTGGLAHKWVEDTLTNNGQGHYDTDASKAAIVNLGKNITTTAQNTGAVYGGRAQQASQLAEISKAYNVGKEQGNFGDVAALVNTMYGTHVRGSDVKDYKNIKSLFDKFLKSGTADEQTLYQQMFGDTGYANKKYNNGNIEKPNYMKLYEKPLAVENAEKADKSFKKLNKNASDLADVLFDATKISLKYGISLDQLTSTATGKAKKIYDSLNAYDKAAVDLFNQPNNVQAQFMTGLQLANSSLAGNKNQGVGQTSMSTQQVLMQLLQSGAGTTQESQAMNALNILQQQQNIANGGLSTLAKAQNSVTLGQAAYNAGPQDVEAHETQRQSYIQQGQEAQASELAFVKQFVEARKNLDLQLEFQNEDYHKQVFRSNRDFNLQLQYQDEDYHKQVFRSNRDFNLQMQYQDQDYRKQVSRENEDFKTQRTRQSEDFAKTVYNPFQRITAVRTADASSLVGNLRQQNKVIKEQMKNVAKLKKLGLSMQSIYTLDLLNPNNAQEVARLVLDMSRDRNLIEQTNAEIKTRGDLATQHENSQFNQNSVRQDADFKKNLGRQEKDYETTVNRAKKAHRQALLDMAKDYGTAIARSVALHRQALADMSTDLHDTRVRAFRELALFGQEVNVTASNAKSLLEGAFAGMPKVAKTHMSTALQNIQTIIKNFKPIGISIPTSVTAPSTTAVNTVAQATAAATVTATAAAIIRIYNNSHAGNRGRPSDEARGFDSKGNTYVYWGKKWHQFKGNDVELGKLLQGVSHKVFKDSKYWSDVTGHPTLAGLNGQQWLYARGGYVHGPGTGKSDSIPARLSNGEYVVQADAVRKYGKSFLDNINAQRLTNASYVNGITSKMSAMQSYGTTITNHTSTQYDQSTQIHGPITVQANDPNEFMRKVNAKKRFQRLSSPVG